MIYVLLKQFFSRIAVCCSIYMTSISFLNFTGKDNDFFGDIYER